MTLPARPHQALSTPSPWRARGARRAVAASWWLLLLAALMLSAAPALGDEPEPTEEPEPPLDEPIFRGREPMRMPMPRIMTTHPSLGVNARDGEGLVRTDGEDALFVGTLTRAESGHPGNPSDYCLEDGKLWQGAEFRFGRVPVFGLPASKRVSDLTPGTVLLSGARKDAIDDRVTEAGPCPEGYGEPWRMMQWRDDWTAPEGSHQIAPPGAPATPPWSHARLKALPYIEADGVEPLDIVQIKRFPAKSDKAGVLITVHNVFNAPLTLPVTLHYEGGPGKPSPHYEEVQVNIPPGERHSFSASLSTSDTDPATKAGRSGVYRLQSVEVRGVIGRVTVEVNAQVN